MRLSARQERRPGRFVEAGRRYAKDLNDAAFHATDAASKLAQRAVQTKIRAVGLGRLSNAVGQTSALQKRQTGRNPYGVIFARGGDNSLAGGALDAYTRGVTIRATNRQWLAFATSAIPSRVNRKRMTPELYERAGFAARFGKLVFRPVKPDLALLVIRNTSVTGRGKLRERGKRMGRGSVAVKEVVAFVLIRQTRRAQRFDKLVVIQPFAAMVPDLMAQFLQRRTRH